VHLRADGPAEGGRNRRPRSTVSHSATGAPDRASAPQNQIGSACMPAPHSTNTALTSSEDSLRRHASHAARYVCVGVWVCMYPWRSIQYRLHTHTHSACGRVCVHTCTHGTHEAPKGASTKEGPCEMRIHPYRSPASAPPSPCLPHELGPRFAFSLQFQLQIAPRGLLPRRHARVRQSGGWTEAHGTGGRGMRQNVGRADASASKGDARWQPSVGPPYGVPSTAQVLCVERGGGTAPRPDQHQTENQPTVRVRRGRGGGGQAGDGAAQTRGSRSFHSQSGYSLSAKITGSAPVRPGSQGGARR